MKFLKVTRTKSLAGQADSVCKTVLSGLGLRKIGSVRKYKDNNCMRGMVNKVSHLVKYELINESSKA